MDLSHVCAVVRALAHRALAVSCCVFVPDCGNLQVLQSSDLPLLANCWPGLYCWISKWVCSHELEVFLSVPVLWLQGHVHLIGLLNSSSSQRSHYCDGVGTQDLFHHDWTKDASAEEKGPQREEREDWLISLLMSIHGPHLEEFRHISANPKFWKRKADSFLWLKKSCSFMSIMSGMEDLFLATIVEQCWCCTLWRPKYMYCFVINLFLSV